MSFFFSVADIRRNESLSSLFSLSLQAHLALELLLLLMPLERRLLGLELEVHLWFVAFQRDKEREMLCFFSRSNALVFLLLLFTRSLVLSSRSLSLPFLSHQRVRGERGGDAQEHGDTQECVRSRARKRAREASTDRERSVSVVFSFSFFTGFCFVLVGCCCCLLL